MEGSAVRASRARKMNSIRVEFADGRSVTSVNAIRTNRRSTGEVLATCPFRDVVPT